MPSPALVSFLGVPGWGPLHLQLAAAADPPAMARRLGRAQVAAGVGATPGSLLSAFLRQERDGQPLPRPWGLLPAGGRSLSHRYRIVCGRTAPCLRVQAWCWQGSGRGWLPCAPALPLAHFVERFACLDGTGAAPVPAPFGGERSGMGAPPWPSPRRMGEEEDGKKNEVRIAPDS